MNVEKRFSFLSLFGGGNFYTKKQYENDDHDNNNSSSTECRWEYHWKFRVLFSIFFLLSKCDSVDCSITVKVTISLCGSFPRVSEREINQRNTERPTRRKNCARKFIQCENSSLSFTIWITVCWLLLLLLFFHSAILLRKNRIGCSSIFIRVCIGSFVGSFVLFICFVFIFYIDHINKFDVFWWMVLCCLFVCLFSNEMSINRNIADVLLVSARVHIQFGSLWGENHENSGRSTVFHVCNVFSCPYCVPYFDIYESLVGNFQRCHTHVCVWRTQWEKLFFVAVALLQLMYRIVQLCVLNTYA